MTSDKYIVAIGASAGGLEAIHEFFDHMPGSASFSFVVIQHLSSDYKSLLVELVSKHTHMKVFEAENDMHIQEDCVYIIPNNKLMTVSDGKLRLAAKKDSKAPNTAIDTFLHTLAHDKRDRAIAVILSGTGTDGTRGIESIKECGGMVIVQDPATARFNGMPNSAIASGNADFILAPRDMHEQLYKYIREEPVLVLDKGKIDDKLLEEIFSMVYSENGHDFNLYKTPTIIRRISRRMNERNVRKLEDYVNLLRDDVTEVKTLGKDFLIGVTKFFRDQPAFDVLRDKVIPAIIAAKSDGDSLKVWVCACSTGEEAYSIAVLINDCVAKSGKKLDIKIFATDIDETSIDIASKNEYPLSASKEIPPDLLEQYFIRDRKYCSVIPLIRKQVVFAKHDVIKSPPFIKNDLVTCRNMLIYMNSVLQQRVLATFHFSLNSGGYLFLGSSETVSGLKEGLSEVSAKWKIYRKTGLINYSALSAYPSGRNYAPARRRAPEQQSKASSLEGDFCQLLTKDLGFAALYIDQSLVIQEAMGDYSKYLSLPGGQIELNILRMVPRAASTLLHAAIRRAWKENSITQVRRLQLKGQEELYVDISVRPPERDKARSYTLLTLCESMGPLSPEKDDRPVFMPENDEQNEYVFELEAELDETRSNLQTAMEEMETTNEELQSSNEELLSANEELQSSNEELQSLNEELHTLNTEHQVKIRELIELNDDLDNYFRSIDIGLIFISADLKIRKFNPAAVKLVNLIDADVGRSIEHISNNIRDENLAADIRSVLHDMPSIEKEVMLKNGRRCLVRILPYVRRDKHKDGVVVTFIDISLVTELNNIISGVFNASTSAIFAFASVRNKEHRIIDFTCTAFNEAALAFTGKNREDLIKASLSRQLEQLTTGSLYSAYTRVVEKGGSYQAEVELGTAWYQVVAVKMADGFAVTFTDISGRKSAEQKLRNNYNELILAREDLKRLNADLEDKVRERTRELSESEERFSLVSQATNDTIWDWDLVQNTMWRSENFARMFGYELNGEAQDTRFWYDKVHPADYSRVRESVDRAINEGTVNWSQEYRFKKADGTYATVLDRGNILRDDFGVPYRMVGSIIDVTRLVETEKKLSSTESRFRKIFESNVIGIFFSNLDTGRIQDANGAFLDMIGYDVAELRSQEMDARQFTPPEFNDVTAEAEAEIRRSGVCKPFEKQYIKKNGKRVSVLVGSALLGGDDNPGEIVTYVINITEQKETEKRRSELQRLIKKQKDQFYSIFKNAPAMITIRRGPDLRYQFVNTAFRDFDGKKEYIGRSTFDVHPEFRGTRFEEIDNKVLETGETFVGRAFQMERIDPATKQLVDCWYDFIFTPVYTDEGEVDGIAFFGFDVTDLVLGQQAARELMRKKDEFMSIASHELKTPITSIKASLQFAKRLTSANTDPEKLSMFIEKANKQIDKLTGLVQDLLDVTKIQGGKMLFDYTKFSSNELIAETVSEMQSSSGHKIIVKEVPDVTLYADRNRVEQVITNFLSNAMKYSPNANEVVVNGEVRNGRFRLTVKDFGIGIPPDKKDYVFDRFFRVQESSHKFSGLGLGLYISAEIIRRHDGTIGVDSEDGHGSEFWFELPVSR